MCLDDALTDLRPDEEGVPASTDHCHVGKTVQLAARKDLRPVTVVDI